VPHFPAKDKWLNEDDRQMLLARLEADKGKEKDKVSKGEWIKVMLDSRVWLMSVFSCPQKLDSHPKLLGLCSSSALLYQPDL
jgi:hypothetical protein